MLIYSKKMYNPPDERSFFYIFWWDHLSGLRSVWPLGGGSIDLLLDRTRRILKPGDKDSKNCQEVTMFIKASSIPGYLNWNPNSSNFSGTTRWLHKTAAASSPMTIRSSRDGVRMKTGRFKTRPMALEKSRFRTGLGEQKLTGPLTASFFKTN